MFARTFLVAGFICISLISLGCDSESAPAVQQSAFPESAQATVNPPAESDDASLPARKTSEDAEYVSPVMAQQPAGPPPRPSYVLWVGPVQNPVDANVVQSTPAPPLPTANRPTTLTPANQPVPAVQGFDQTIQKVDKPSLTADTQPVLTDVAGPPVKVAGDSGNSTAQQTPLALAKLSSTPAGDAVSPTMVRADDAIKEAQESRGKVAKIANDAANSMVDPIGPPPPPATPAPPDAVAEAQNNFAEAAKLLPSQRPKVASFESMLEQLPNEARPLAKIGWDGFSIPKAHKWIKEQLAGVELQVAVEIVDVKLIRIPDAKDPDQTVGWELALTTKPERFHAFGLDAFHWPATWTEDVSGRKWRGGEVRFPVAEDFAKQARAWRVGDIIVLSGTVEDTFVEGGMTNLGQPCGRFTTIFENVQVDRLIPQGDRP